MPAGSSTLDFGNIPDGGSAALPFTLTGVVIGDSLAAAWPSALPAGLLGAMIVTASDTVQVRLFNLSGADIDPSSLTYGAVTMRRVADAAITEASDTISSASVLPIQATL